MWRSLTHLTRGVIVLGALLLGPNAAAQTDRASDQRNAAEFQTLIDRVLNDNDAEARITALEAALKLEPRIKAWNLPRSRQWYQGALWQILGNELQERTAGNRDDNLDKAIAAYQKSLKILTKNVSASDWATTQNNLGETYRKRGQSQDIERAIAAFEAALTVAARAPESWAITQFNLGIAYSERTNGSKADNIEKAIKANEAALTVYTKLKSPKDWAETQVNLGGLLRERVLGDRAENIERSIEVHETALTALTREEFPREWAKAQFGLARSYDERVLGNPAENIEKAIGIYELALTVYNRDADPERWATTQSNLATTYTNRLRGDKASNIERAIKGYEASLSVFTRETRPYAWANTQDLLGTAYGRRIRGNRADNLEQAIKAHEAALTVYTQEHAPREWAHTKLNLAGTFQRRVLGSYSENLKRTIEGYEAALTVLTRETSPREWAMIQENLGMALIERGDGDHSENQERGIKAYEAALSVFTRDALPEYWAHTQANLSKVYAYRIRGNSADNLQRAIEAAQKAIQVYTPDTYPRDFLEQVVLLGPAFITTGNWPAAASLYREARKAFLVLFAGGLDEAQARDLLDSVGPLFALAAYVAVEQGQNETALGLLDEGKARLMAVALRQRGLDLSPESRDRYQRLRTDIRHWIDAAAAAKGVEGAQAIRNLEASRSELFKLLESASANTGGHNSVAELTAALVPDRGAIVAPIVTHFGGKILIVTKAANRPVISVLPLPEFSTQRIRQLLRGDPRIIDALGGWFGNYLKNYEMVQLAADIHALSLEEWELRSTTDEKKIAERTAIAKQRDEKVGEYRRLDEEWLTAIMNVGSEMWPLFAGALDKALRERGIAHGAQIIWLPPGLLGTLPLGLAQDPDSKRRFSDTYEIVYAPSLVALKAAKDQLAKPFTASLVSVANPTGNLPFADIEGALVARYFEPRARVLLNKSQATPDAVLSAIKGKSYWHFSTHGTFSWEDPLNSALSLSGGNRSVPFTIRELLLAQGIGRPRLVVLSACETGLYENKSNPEEFTGLPSAFMSLGAAGVLGTLWLVDDRATMLLMAKFYDLHLRGGLAPSAALGRAQDWLRGAKKQELIAYAQEAAKAGHIKPDDVARIANSLRRSDVLVRFGYQIGGSEPGAQADDGQARGASAVSGQRSESPPYAHPYFWGGFIYTGL
jgi:CHAT domain-containing protein/tetratricopeptide (TPR) repeat protein